MSQPITRPTNMSLMDWADNVLSDLREFGVVAILSGEDWQSWGAQLCGTYALGVVLPDPYQFNDWKLWAERVCDTLA